MKRSKQPFITPQLLEQGMSYDTFRIMIDELLEEDKTTGPNQADYMVQYTRMNVRRMNRWDKRISLNPSLKEKSNEVQQPWIWLILNEAWCGSASHSLPVIAKIADKASNIEIKIILRDKHPHIMDEYLTDGARSIPKLICLHAESLEEIGTWGPRTKSFQKKAMKWKNNPEISKEDWIRKQHQWARRDQSETLQNEFQLLINEWIHH